MNRHHNGRFRPTEFAYVVEPLVDSGTLDPWPYGVQVEVITFGRLAVPSDRV